MPFDYRKEFYRYRRYYLGMRPLLKTPKARAYTMLILSLFALSFFGFLAIRPTVKTITELRRKITDQRMINQKLEEKIKALTLAQQEYESLQNDFPLILAALPQKPNFPPLLKRLEKTASDSGLLISQLKFQSVPLIVNLQDKEPSLTLLSFELSLVGSYPNLFSFLTSLERMERFVLLDSATFKAEKQEEGKINLIIKGSAYQLP